MSFDKKMQNFQENADGYFDYLTSVQVWNNPRAMYMDKENTLWKLSCVLLTRAKRAKCHAACKLSELCEFLHAACNINFASLPAQKNQKGFTGVSFPLYISQRMVQTIERHKIISRRPFQEIAAFFYQKRHLQWEYSKKVFAIHK